jgi:DnaK suppressor protein
MARSDARPRTDAGPGTGALARVGAALFQALADARARVADLGAELEAVIAAAAATPTDDEHDAEGATVGFERARIAALLEGAMAQLGELEIAERRFTAGEGWRCVQCGLEIPPERVAALPATTRCVASKGVLRRNV